MREQLNFWVIGGDMRQVRLAGLLAADGHSVHTFALEQGEIDEFAHLLNEHWRLSCKLDQGTTNTCIDQIRMVCEEFTEGLFIAGAGGGGFLQGILKKGVQKEDLRKALRQIFQDSGVDVWEAKLLLE